MKKSSRLVYSTETGRIKPQADQDEPPQGDGILRIRRETKGRNGGTVTSISGFDSRHGDIKALAKSLKQRCGTGGTSKPGVIEIQGDHREKIKAALEAMDFAVKLAGG